MRNPASSYVPWFSEDGYFGSTLRNRYSIIRGDAQAGMRRKIPHRAANSNGDQAAHTWFPHDAIGNQSRYHGSVKITISRRRTCRVPLLIVGSLSFLR